MKMHWKVILGILGAVLPSFFTYLAARSDSNEAKIRAEVAYVTMQEVVKELQEASYKQALQLAKIEGELEAERRVHSESKMPPGVHPLLPAHPPAPSLPPDTDGIPDVQVKLKPPPNFSDAVQSYKAAKK